MAGILPPGINIPNLGDLLGVNNDGATEQTDNQAASDARAGQTNNAAKDNNDNNDSGASNDSSASNASDSNKDTSDNSAVATATGGGGLSLISVNPGPTATPTPAEALPLTTSSTASAAATESLDPLLGDMGAVIDKPSETTIQSVIATTTTTPTALPATSNADVKGMVPIIAGAGGGGLVLIIAIIALIVRSRRGRWPFKRRGKDAFERLDDEMGPGGDMTQQNKWDPGRMDGRISRFISNRQREL